MTRKPDEGLRLQVFLARAGVASRRAAEELIRQGLVSVNGEVVVELGTRVVPERDHVRLEGRLVRRQEAKVHLLLNKPRGVVSTASDPQGRETVVDLVRVRGVRLYPVGRLDLQSEGLMLLTNDGELAEKLLHPRFEVPRTYLAKIRGHLDEKLRRRLAAGILLEGRKTGPLRVRPTKTLENASWVEVVVHEGRQHLVRDALAEVGHPVVKLKRIAFGPLRLGRLASGASRPLTPDELEALAKLVSGGPKRPSSRSGRKPTGVRRERGSQTKR